MKRLGFKIPGTYSPKGQEKTGQALLDIEKDIRKTLPAVLQKTRIEDIKAIIRNKHGALRHVQRLFKVNSSQLLEISEYSAKMYKQ